MPDGFTPVDFDIIMTVVILQRLKTRCKCASTVNWGSRPVQPGRQTKKFRQCADVGIRIENLGGGVANIPFQTVSFPLILPGMAPSICAPGQ